MALASSVGAQVGEGVVWESNGTNWTFDFSSLSHLYHTRTTHTATATASESESESESAVADNKGGGESEASGAKSSWAYTLSLFPSAHSSPHCRPATCVTGSTASNETTHNSTNSRYPNPTPP